ncbi:MAG: double zinc ribbon domain-containing protein, partial [Gemmataceae bacterium]
MTPPRFIRNTLDWLYPPICLACSTRLQELAPFCPDCFRELHQPRLPYCGRCGSVVPEGPRHPADRCPRCRNDSFRYDRLYRLAVYEGWFRDAVLKGKALPGEYLLEFLGEELARHLETQSAPKFDIITPVPLH